MECGCGVGVCAVMAKHPWMPLYVADYLADTGHLTGAEHGAYLLLIMHYWTCKCIPNDDARLSRIARMSLEEWQRSKPVIQDFFDFEWKHKRIEAELAKSEDISHKRRTAAEQRHSKSNANAHANGVQKDTQSQSQSHLEEEKKEDAAIAAPDARTRLFTKGLSSLHRQTGKPEQALRALVGRWLRDVEDDAVLVHRTIEDAERNRVADAVAWITRALKPKARPPEVQTRKDLNREKWSNALERLGDYASAPASSDVSKEIVRFLPAARSGKS